MSVRLLLLLYNLMVMPQSGEDCLRKVCNPLTEFACLIQSREAKDHAGHPRSHLRQHKCQLGGKIRCLRCAGSYFIPINTAIGTNILDASDIYACDETKKIYGGSRRAIARSLSFATTSHPHHLLGHPVGTWSLPFWYILCSVKVGTENNTLVQETTIFRRVVKRAGESRDRDRYICTSRG